MISRKDERGLTWEEARAQCVNAGARLCRKDEIFDRGASDASGLAKPIVGFNNLSKEACEAVGGKYNASAPVNYRCEKPTYTGSGFTHTPTLAFPEYYDSNQNNVTQYLAVGTKDGLSNQWIYLTGDDKTKVGKSFRELNNNSDPNWGQDTGGDDSMRKVSICCGRKSQDECNKIRNTMDYMKQRYKKFFNLETGDWKDGITIDEKDIARKLRADFQTERIKYWTKCVKFPFSEALKLYQDLLNELNAIKNELKTNTEIREETYDELSWYDNWIDKNDKGHVKDKMNPNYPDNRPIYKRTPAGNIYKDGGRLQQLIDNIERLKLLIIKEKERYAKCPLSCYHEMSETPGYQFQWTDFENGKKFKCRKCVSDDDGNSAVDPVDPTRLVVVGEDDKGNLIKERVAVFRQPATEKISANL